jgi:hypothetical protein
MKNSRSYVLFGVNILLYMVFRMEHELVRSHRMAERLEVSVRGLANLKKLGMPYTQVLGVTWYSPAKVYKWLSQFERNGAPGKRHHRAPAVLEPLKTAKQREPLK